MWLHVLNIRPLPWQPKSPTTFLLVFFCNIGWIGSISWANSFFFSPLAVAIERCIGHRLTVVLGCTLASCCYLVTSLMTTYIGVLAFLGIICGTALCFSIHAMMCVLFKAFADSGRQSMAMSIALVGASVGKKLSVSFN